MSDYYPASTEALPLFAMARRRDPSTSHAAAKVAPVRSHGERIVAALRLGSAGQSEIGARCGLLPHKVNKRLTELQRLGRVELTGREVQGLSGCMEREWRVTDGR